MNSKASKSNISPSRKWLFNLITLSIPLILLLIIEGGLRLVSYGDKLSLFIDNPTEGYEDYLILNPVVGKKYFQKLEYSLPPNDIFLKKKAEGSFRIFVMGSSTVVGFPYSYNLMFSRILHKRLEESYPNQQIEVVNTAITAINSYTLRDYAREIRKYQPDAVLIYAGHNEFYGAFGIGSRESMSKSLFFTRLHLNMMDFRFYQLIRKLINSTISKIASGKSDQVHGTLMKRIVGNSSIGYNSKEYKLAMKRYDQNMADLIQYFKNDETPVFLSSLISNVKDIRPLSSVSTGTKDKAWKNFEKAESAFANRHYEEAFKLFYEAKDLDEVRFRASEEANRIIEKLSKDYETYHVPMLEYFQSHSDHNLIGNNLLTEHVHPNIEGSFLMAEAFYSEIIKSGILGEPTEKNIHSSDYFKQNWGYTALDILLAYHRIANLKNYWPFVPISANIPDYLSIYKPVSILDSIAFIALKEKSQNISDMRLKLAKEYTAKGLHKEAYMEYEAILCTNPYLAVNYRDAASSLLSLGDLPLALQYLMKSLTYDKSFFASYRMGEIYMIKSDYINAISSFKEAFESADNDADKIKLLGKLYIVYNYANQLENAKAIKKSLLDNSASQYLSIPTKTYTYYNYVPYKTRDIINSALELISKENYVEALSQLEVSLSIYDTPLAHKYIADCYFKMGNDKKAVEQFDIVYDEFSFDPDFLVNFIMLNIKQNDYQKAEIGFNKLKIIDPNSKSIQMIALMLSQTQTKK